MGRRFQRSKALGLAALIVTLGALSSWSVAHGATYNQTFTLVFTADPSQEPGRVIAHGPVVGAGAVRITSASDAGFLSRYEFAAGTLAVAVTPTASSFQPDFVSCTARAETTSAVSITGGTGAYVGASGSGVATSRAFLVWERGPQGECLLGQAPPVRGVEIVTVNTTLVLP